MYAETVAAFTDFFESGEFQTKIQDWARERVPPVPQLFFVTVDTDSFSTDGTFTNQMNDPRDTVKAILVTMTGELVTTGLTMSMTDAQLEEVIGYFKDAITLALAADLPEGSIVTVTGIESQVQGFSGDILDGVVSYEISFAADTPAFASASVTAIKTSLSNDSTLAEITTLVNPTLVGIDVESNTDGSTTETTVAKVTLIGQLTTNLAGMTLVEVLEATMYFEDAIKKTVDAATDPQGISQVARRNRSRRLSSAQSLVVFVTDIDSDGVVSYDIIMYLSLGVDSAQMVNGIISNLSLPSTQASIATEVTSNAASSGSTISALASLVVTGFIEGSSSGVSFEKWYPNWFNHGSFCVNDGYQPRFMNHDDNRGSFLFDTQSECCRKWYSYSDSCETVVGQATDGSGDWYVDYGRKKCVRDCESGANCGGLKNSWDISYANVNDCCDRILWIPRQDCI